MVDPASPFVRLLQFPLPLCLDFVCAGIDRPGEIVEGAAEAFGGRFHLADQLPLTLFGVIRFFDLAAVLPGFGDLLDKPPARGLQGGQLRRFAGLRPFLDQGPAAARPRGPGTPG